MHLTVLIWIKFRDRKISTKYTTALHLTAVHNYTKFAVQTIAWNSFRKRLLYKSRLILFDKLKPIET